MEEKVIAGKKTNPFYTREHCWVEELSNSASDPELSIARIRVAAGVTTELHRLKGTAERYLILSGRARMELGVQPAVEVGPDDVVLVPPGCSQRICNITTEDLIFLVVCTPRFRPEVYEALEEP
ncbi:cupin domain-containing protein [Desulfobotulus sp. H1]|uniref:Cupin domain-containing protein n=1 Tax=Desulfobotulus pelophilus TaxID=2823377 RepID=A0ABT3N9W1_9BACT|nr:cupin domain-containing protein [Desulfobotulus pelophilus]MCW7754252.1 cupin domain-containing protein [Desulfobotulus pelophilus]